MNQSLSVWGLSSMQILMNFAALLMSGRDCGDLGYPLLDCLILLIHGIEAARSGYIV